jgi:GxxExxY protein
MLAIIVGGMAMISDDITHRVIGVAYEVSNTLGVGFLERVYENALVIEMRKAGLYVEQQKPITVYYQGTIVGEYTADVLVEHELLLELKVARVIDENHRAQVMNYLRGTGLHVGLILNFGTPSLGVKRVVA